jgi:hypothetical protein
MSGMSETVAPAPRTSQIEAPMAAEFIRSPDPSLPTNTVAEEGDGIAVADGALLWRISPLEAARLVWEAPLGRGRAPAEACLHDPCGVCLRQVG